jgi:serine protease AprX
MLSEQELERLLLHSTGWQRFTQDSPIFADVWMGYRGTPLERKDLLLEPHHRKPSGVLAKAVRERLKDVSREHELAYAGEYVAAKLTLPELVTAVLPLSSWWRKLVRPRVESVFAHLEDFARGDQLAPDAGSDPVEVPPPDDELQWLLTVVGRLLTDTSDAEARELHYDDPRELTRKVLELLGHPDDRIERDVLPLWSVSRNRKVKATLWRSRQTVKADAATRVFPPDSEGLAWAVVDSGIDATHPAFRRRNDDGTLRPLGSDFTTDTIVRATLDFTGLRGTIAATMLNAVQGEGAVAPPSAQRATTAVRDALVDGLAVDWSGYEPLIQVHHVQERQGPPGQAPQDEVPQDEVPQDEATEDAVAQDEEPDEYAGEYEAPQDEEPQRPGPQGGTPAGFYRPPVHAHGTHVAGTIAGDWRPEDPVPRPRHALQGVFAGLTLYDLRVLDDDGVGDEFDVLAALSYVRWRNSQSGGTVIHGVNLSFALEHDVLNSACGRSPICLEADRVHNAGVVVVAAAGNDGRAEYRYRGQTSEGYRTVSISDPGNAEAAITVGSTHRLEPHAYGVSYFSSRGPTGDGRAKPDIVAPGEKITGPVPGAASARMDGTSMAAPHVSGAAALLMARHRELIGQPARVKRVLCDTATDLGREHHYQGHGLVDILRALQSV